jgi:hypothetical protein
MYSKPNHRLRRAWTVSILAVIISGSAIAQQNTASVVQGELIGAQPKTNAVPAAVTTPADAAPVAAKSGDYLQVGFDKLSGFPLRLHWVLVDPVRIKGVQSMMGDVPPYIKSLDNGKIAVRGFMLPLKLEDGKVTEFFLLRTQARCCYGLPIQMNELLTVHMAKPGVKSIMDQPVTIYGRLHVSESHDDTGALTSIYTLDGEKMDEPSNL